MKALSYNSSKTRAQVKHLVETEATENIKQAYQIGQQDIMLRTLYVLRTVFGFKARLNDFISALSDLSLESMQYRKDLAYSTVLIKRLADTGYDVKDAFKELEEYELNNYRRKTEKENAIRRFN